jgi:hypothetical protein
MGLTEDRRRKRRLDLEPATPACGFFPPPAEAGFAPRNKKVLAGCCGPIVPGRPTRI